MTFYGGSSNKTEQEKMIELQSSLIKDLNKVVSEIRDLLKERLISEETQDNTLSSLKDKDLIRLEVGASRNNNEPILKLIKKELRRRGLFVEEPQTIPVKMELFELKGDRL
nr:hypothetical protein [Carrot chordovirus 4]